jgi:hypothetical protein
MREVSPKELIERNIDSFRPIQKKVRRLLRKSASAGKRYVSFYRSDFERIEEIISWLVSCGFVISETAEDGQIVITWPEEKAEPKRLGEWVFDELPYEFFCTNCQKHSEYATKFCPNCGEEKDIE